MKKVSMSKRLFAQSCNLIKTEISFLHWFGFHQLLRKHIFGSLASKCSRASR